MLDFLKKQLGLSVVSSVHLYRPNEKVDNRHLAAALAEMIVNGEITESE